MTGLILDQDRLIDKLSVRWSPQWPISRAGLLSGRPHHSPSPRTLCRPTHKCHVTCRPWLHTKRLTICKHLFFFHLRLFHCFFIQDRRHRGSLLQKTTTQGSAPIQLWEHTGLEYKGCQCPNRPISD